MVNFNSDWEKKEWIRDMEKEIPKWVEEMVELMAEFENTINEKDN